MKKRSTIRGRGIRKKIKTKTPSSTSKEQRLLEQAIETMVKQMTVLENQITLLRKTLQKCDAKATLEEGRELVQQSSDISENLASSLSQVKKELDLSTVGVVKSEGSQYEEIYGDMCLYDTYTPTSEVYSVHVISILYIRTSVLFWIK